MEYDFEDEKRLILNYLEILGIKVTCGMIIFLGIKILIFFYLVYLL